MPTFSIFRIILIGALFIGASIASIGQHSDIWGTSYRGGNFDVGYIFRMDADGSSFDKVHHFKGGIQGQWPNGALTEGADGKLYGLTAQGGENGNGIIYSYDPQYDVFTIEYHLTINLGQKLLLAPNGKFYINSSQSSGSLYIYDPVARTLSLVYDYSNAEGRSTFADENFILVDDHRIIGTTYSGGSMDDGVLFEYDLDTNIWQVLHSFGSSEGRAPSPTIVILGRKLYGTTIWGGDNGRGALYEYDLDTETLTAKAHFTTDSSQAVGVCVGPDGKIYLQAPTGGGNIHGGVLRYDPTTEDLDLIHSFASSGANITTGSIFQSWEGRLFGVTRYGGSGAGLGIVYEINVGSESISTQQSFNDGLPIDSRLLEVGERLVSSVTIQAPANSIDTDNGTLLLGAALLPAETTDQPVVWSVDDTDVATINAEGLLTAVGNGTVQVTATANFGNGVSDSINIAVTNQDASPPVIPVQSISASPSQAYLTTLGDTQQLYADFSPINASNQSVNWASSDNAVATVSNTGLLEATGAGTATITLTATDGSASNASIDVEVTQLVTGLTITPNTDTIDELGETIDFDIIVTPANATNPDVTWSVSSIYASIDQDGVFGAENNGEFTVTATANDGSGVSTTHTVTASNQYVVVQGVNAYYSLIPRATQSTITENLGTLQLTKVFSPSAATNPSFTWTSTKPEIATVDQDGLVTAVSNGITTIRITSADGPSDTHKILVYYQDAGPATVSSIELTPETATINERGGTLQLSATSFPEGAAENDFSWELVGSGGTISQNGLVTGSDNGEVQIRAYTQDLYGKTIRSPYATITLINQDDPLARIEPEFNIVEGKARLSYTRFVPGSGVTIAHQGTSDLSLNWQTLILNTHYIVHDTTDHGDGTETIVLELTGDTPNSYFLQVTAEQE